MSGPTILGKNLKNRERKMTMRVSKVNIVQDSLRVILYQFGIALRLMSSGKCSDLPIVGTLRIISVLSICSLF